MEYKKYVTDVLYELFLRYGGRYAIGYYYYVIFTHDGMYKISLQDADHKATLQDYTFSPCLISGPNAVNHLTAVMQGPRLDLYANGCYLTSVINDRLADGEVGFGAGRFQGPGQVNVRFDNFRAYGLNPLRPAAFGSAVNSTLSKEELEDRGELLGLRAFPKDPSITQFPGGTKRVEIFVPYEGMVPSRQISETAFIDGQEVWNEGPFPWAHHVREQGRLAFGVYMRTFKMQKGSDLPTGHWEWRMYVDGVPVTRSFFSVGVDTPPPMPEPLQLASAPPPPQPSLPSAEESFAQAAALYGQGHYTEAVPYCERAMAVAPNSTQLMTECAKVYEAASRPEWAQMLRQMAQNLDRLLAGKQPLAANTPASVVSAGDTPIPIPRVVPTTAPVVSAVDTPAPPALETKPSVSPGVSSEYVARANALYDQGDYQAVVDLATRQLAEVSGADAVELYFNLGRAYFQLGWPNRDEELFTKSTSALNQLLAANPNDARAYDYLGRIRYRLGDPEGAWSLLEKATALDPALPNPYSYRGRIHYERKEYAQAIPQFQAYLDNGGKTSEAFVYEMIGRSYYFWKWTGGGPTDYAQALAALNKALELDPNNSNINDFLGRIYYYQEDYGRAQQFLERASQLNPKWSDPYYFRGQIAYRQKDFEQAIPLFQQYLDVGGEVFKVDSYNHIGWGYYRLKQYGEAEQAFLSAIALTQSNDNVYGGLGWVYVESGRCPEAIQMFEKAIQLAPDFDGWKDGLGRCRK